MTTDKKVIALVGMAGSGKSWVASYLRDKRGLPVVRFGQQTDRGLRQLGLANTEENEKKYREKLRNDLGMAAYASKALPRIEVALSGSDTVFLDGLYSFEEYEFLKEYYSDLLVIAIIADRAIRYDRLEKREVRGLSQEQAYQRDVAEIVNIHKSGPIAIADYYILNNGVTEDLRKDTDALLQRLNIQ